MGAVDRLDKSVALANIHIRRCQRRYHRQIFFWYLSAVGFHNVKVLFEKIVGDEEIKRLREENKDFGYFHWVQYTLAEGLIDHGLKRATREARDSAVPGAEPCEGQCTSLHFLPSEKRVHRPVPTPSVHTEDHGKPTPVQDIEVKDLNGNSLGALKRGRCVNCFAKAKFDKVKRVYMMPNGKACPMPRYGCKVCKVCLCWGCFHLYDHKNNQRHQCVRVPIDLQS